MLKYNIKLTDDSMELEELVWSEKYLAPDLSFVSGVTLQDYHLEKFNKLPIRNSLVNNSNSIANLETKNVRREGYVIIKEKAYEPNSGSVVDYSVESGGSVSAYTYLFLNGKYYYASGNTFHIDHWLQVDNDTRIPNDESGITIPNTSNIKIDTIAWIEDGLVNIDGHEYIFERDIETEDGKGGLKYYENGECLEASAITECEGIEYHLFESSDDCLEVTKFKLTKEEEVSEEFDRISFCKRFYYIKYKEQYLPITLSGNTFVCEIPNYLLCTTASTEDSEYYETSAFTLNLKNDESSALDPNPLTGTTFDVFLDSPAVVIIEGEQFIVRTDIMNSNDGKEIAVYLNGDTANISLYDKLRFVDSSEDDNLKVVYQVSNSGYGFNQDDDTDFVLFNSVKYKVEENICDKVIINDNEYSINYINGKEDKVDCLVEIEDESVPMKISGLTSGEYSAGTLVRYGRIISGTSDSAITAAYSIKPYSGITINDKKYIIREEESEEETEYYAYLDRNNEYTFVVTDIIGSSMVVCKPDFNITDFTKDFNELISREICTDVVDNQDKMILYVKNKIFGDKEITKELAFQTFVEPTSSDDYYNLFDDLIVYTKSGYIHIPISLTAQQGNNVMQDDIVESQFFDEVKRREINPIVDMEKDVYSPKYMVGNAYNGSETEFLPISAITVNLHFRTRNLDNWRVNEGYNDVSTSAGTSGESENWFITDYHPYRDILSGTTGYQKLIDKETLEPCASVERASEILMNTSDLVGLLNFTNDDVFYQHNNIAKSFLRFSFYDSTNPQTQSLLATSCVFMDEHKLFKTFIDNSRKNISDFGYVENPNVLTGRTVNKIRVNTEYLGKRQDREERELPLTYNEFSGVVIDNSHRLGSEFIINNKYETDTSSEGYYIYIFREYSENLKPMPIYMKVEFNHAGIGRTIPFVVPMHWSEPDDNGNKTPIRTLSLGNSDDLDELKGGIRLGDVYAQTYIPLYAVYDFQNKEYAYVFDSRYINQEELENTNQLNLNLFELKVMNENQPTSDTQQRDITMKRQETAKIDRNERQFPLHEGGCND